MQLMCNPQATVKKGGWDVKMCDVDEPIRDCFFILQLLYDLVIKAKRSCILRV